MTDQDKLFYKCMVVIVKEGIVITSPGPLMRLYQAEYKNDSVDWHDFSDLLEDLVSRKVFEYADTWDKFGMHEYHLINRMPIRKEG